MGSKKINYQWRLFVPFVALLWFTIAAMVAIQYDREKAYRSNIATQQLEFINNRIVFAYEHGGKIAPFMEFVKEYFEQSVYDEVRVSVYNTDTHQLIYAIGEPIKYNKTDSDKRPNFFYSEKHSRDNSLVVYTAMPYSISLTEALAPDSTMWLIILVFAIMVSIMAFIFTFYLSKNVKLLHKFAKQAATETSLDANYRFPKDELGEVSQQIVDLFNSKAKAVEDSEHEHKIALDAIKEKSRIKRELTNNINHEIKTPVGIIKGYIDTIAEDYDMPASTRQHFIVKIQEQITRLCNLLNDISMITRLSEAAASIPTEDINFHDLVYTIADDAKESGLLNEMSFSFNIPLNCHINGNSGLLNSAILNLIKNAVSYSKGTAIRLEKIHEDDYLYTFRFYDNGTGVGEEHIPYLFDRFYRIDAGRSRKVGGTGLGLPIVKNTIRTLGGKITVRNRIQGGLEYNFTLPRAKGYHLDDDDIA